MSINTDIWGAPETWDAYGTTKVPNFAGAGSYKNSILGGIDTGVFEWNGAPIDITCAPWGINKDSAMCNSNWLYVGASVGGSWDTLDNVTIYTREIYENTGDMPYLPTLRGLAYGGLSKNSVPFSYQYTPNAGSYNSYKTYNNTVPILAFAYNNIVVVPWVMCCKTNPNAASGYDLFQCSVKDYFETYKTTYPWICSLYIKGYFSGDRPDVVLQRTVNTSDYNNSRATFNRWDNRIIKQQICSWNGNFSQYRANMRYAGGFTYEVIAGREISNPNPIEFYLNRNEVYTGDDIAFARWSYSGEPPVIRGNMFEFDYKFTEPRLYVTPKWDATLTDVMRELAFYGYWYTLDENKARTAYTGQYCNDDDMCIPVFDENGVTTGEYKTGTAAAAIAPADAATPADFIDYDPYAPPVPPDDGDSGDLGNFKNFADTNHFNYPCTVYALTETNFRNFAEALNALYLTDQDTTQMELDFKGSNPTDYIINCYALPFEPEFLSSTEVGVQIGPQTLINITGKVVNTATSFYIDCGSKTIPRRGNFLDFEPYTHIELYLPMCGTVTLDPALVVGKTIRVVMYYNILTNSATAAVYRISELGDSLIATSTGEIGVSIPFTAYNMGQYQNAIKSTENAIKQNGLKVATGVATTAIGIAGALLAPETGGLSLALTGAALAGGSSALSAAMKGGELHYELEHIAPSVSQCSSADGSLAHVIAKTIPWLFIKRARMLQSYDEEVYAKTIGHACCINDILGGSEESPRSGLTVCSNIDTSGIQKEVSTGLYIAPTVEEINAIKQAAASGIIL